MKRVRVQLVWLSPAVVALFALTIAAPRSALLYHEHAGGTRAHTHADSDDLADLLAQHGHRHDHDHAAHDHVHQGRYHHHDTDVAPAAVPGPTHTAALSPLQSARAVLVHEDAAATGHWHEQLRFHRAVIAALPATAVSTFAAAAPQLLPNLCALAAPRTRQARAPPHTAPFA